MPNPYRAYCDDFYVTLRLGSQVALPQQRETVLHYFEQLQKAFPGMTRFRKSENGELHLEEDRSNESYRWTSLESRRLSAGYINPPALEDAGKLHASTLEMAQPLLGISPVEIDYLDVLFGFDLEFSGNHDEIITESLLPESPLTSLMDEQGARPVDVQPTVTVSLSEDCRLQARLEVITRTNSYQVRTGAYSDEPISIYLVLRRYWGDRPRMPIEQIAQELLERADALCTSHVVPKILRPVSAAIASRS